MLFLITFPVLHPVPCSAGHTHICLGVNSHTHFTRNQLSGVRHYANCILLNKQMNTKTFTKLFSIFQNKPLYSYLKHNLLSCLFNSLPTPFWHGLTNIPFVFYSRNPISITNQQQLIRLVWHGNAHLSYPKKMPQSGVGSMQGSNEGCLPLKVVFHHRLSSNKGCLPLKVIFHQRSSSSKGRLSPKVVFQQRLSSRFGKFFNF